MTFSFHRGSLSLDFAGTLGQRASPEPEERLPHPAAFADWLREAGLPVPVRLGERELAAARSLREAVYTLGAQAVDGQPPDRAALKRLNAAARGVVHGSLRMDGRGRRAWSTDDALRFSLGRIAEDAIVQLSDGRDRLTRCELPGCGALLLSRSRSDRRRWCSMETCGNRAKVAAFRARRAKRAR